MKVEDIKKEVTKYARFNISGYNKNNDHYNFELLFRYIGENSDSDKKTCEGRAYYEIRKETDKILKVSFLKNKSLKTSKSEIKTIRQYFKNIVTGELTMKIPYKIEYIFRAIINVVERLEKKAPLSPELELLKGKCYGKVFYDKYINTYNNHFCDIKKDYLETGLGKCRYELKNDFDASNSPFRVSFK